MCLDCNKKKPTVIGVCQSDNLMDRTLLFEGFSLGSIPNPITNIKKIK